jgi:ABC-type phosphate transport system substrate-binding protein
MVGDALTSVCPDQTLVEVPEDQPAPLKVTTGTPSAEEIVAFEENCTPGTTTYVPLYGYPVTLAYNIPGLEGLVLTPEAIAGILNGTITSWEDPAITEPNASFDLTLLPEIQVMSTEAPSGAVQAMTTWLTNEVPDVWTDGVVETLPNSLMLPTAEELALEMTLMEGTVAVMPVFEAIYNLIPAASLPVVDAAEGGTGETVYVGADDVQLAKIGIGAIKVMTDEAGNIAADPAVGGVPVPENFDFASTKVILQEGQPMVGWPVNGVGHLLVCDTPDNPVSLSVAQYALRLAGQGALESYGLTPIPEPVRISTFTPLKVTVSEDSAAG